MPITGQTYFLPTQITGCSLWLDAADSSTVILSGVNVTQWRDKSGNAANATASGNGILYTQSAINSKPAILLPGNSTYTFFTGTSISGTLNQAIFIVVTTISGITQYARLFSFGGAGDYNSLGNMVVGWNSPGGVLIERNGIFLPSTNALVYSTPFITSSVISGTSVLGYINGTNTLTGTTTSTNFTHSQYELGSYTGFSGYSWYGYVGEVIIYNSSISDTQRQQVESYLAQKWSLTSSLISGHPGIQKIIYRNLQTTFTKKQYFTAFSPRQISGLGLWFDATDSSTITLSSGSLTQWNDKSGNGRNLTAVSGFANATVSSAYQNGLNVFNFSGNGLYRTDLGNVFYPLDVYIVVALKSLTNHVDVLGMGDTAVDNFNSLTFAESAASRWHNGSSFGNRQTISTSNETSLSFLLIQWSIANGNYLLRRNGTQLVQASQTYSFSYPASSAFQIGFRHTNINAANFSGYIGEIVVFNNQIGTTDRQNVESYLAQKWGLVSSLAAGHLNETFPAGSPTAIQPFVSRIRPALTNIAKATGGIITNVGGRRFHTFINNGTFSIVSAMPGKIFEVFAIGGGGGGGGFEGGGGGGGGLVTYTSSLSVGNYSITIGTGGTGGTASSVAGGNGTSTLFSSLVTAIGGGGGGSSFGGSPANGGCGGGGAYNQSYGTGSQGFNGAVASPSLYWGGGGGGTSASATNNNGGAGTLYYGSYYGGGGGGGGNQGPNGTGGIGGGGDGGGSGTPSVQYITPAPVAGAANTGGGGGGHGYNGTTGAIGGTGICIVSYIYP